MAIADIAEVSVQRAEPKGLRIERRFTREGVDRWRGRTGQQAGEVLLVARDDSGTPTAVDIATFILPREPLPAG